MQILVIIHLFYVSPIPTPTLGVLRVHTNDIGKMCNYISYPENYYFHANIDKNLFILRVTPSTQL